MKLDILRKEIAYCPSTGNLTWLKTGPGRGEKPGYVGSGGYIYIGVAGHRFLAHRLAWYLTYGCMPSKQIDHIDSNRLNNAITNLRLASTTENNRNASLRSDNQSGVRGVCWRKREGRWHAQISVDGKNISIGYFKDLERAKIAYAEASKKYHGEFGKAT